MSRAERVVTTMSVKSSGEGLCEYSVHYNYRKSICLSELRVLYATYGRM